jgi:hypothetical protein
LNSQTVFITKTLQIQDLTMLMREQEHRNSWDRTDYDLLHCMNDREDFIPDSMAFCSRCADPGLSKLPGDNRSGGDSFLVLRTLLAPTRK